MIRCSSARDGSRSIRHNLDRLSPNSDMTQISHCSTKGLLVTEVMRIENTLTQVQFSRHFDSFSPLFLLEMYGDKKGEFLI